MPQKRKPTLFFLPKSEMGNRDLISRLTCQLCGDYFTCVMSRILHLKRVHNRLVSRLFFLFFLYRFLLGFFTILQLQYLRTESGWVGEFLAGSRTRGRLNPRLLLLIISHLSSQEFYLLGRPSTSMSAIMRPQTSFSRWWRPFSLKPSHSSSLPSSLDYRRVPNLPARFTLAWYLVLK